MIKNIILTEEEQKHKKKIKKSTLRHYDNMMSWVITQDAEETPRRATMYLAIEEDWGAYNCMYCADAVSCPECLLYVPDKMKILDHCCGGLWSKLDDAETWREWLKWANMVVKFIKMNG